MGLFSGAMKTGLAKKAFDEARKPQNQQRIKDLVGTVAARRKGGAGGTIDGRRVR